MNLELVIDKSRVRHAFSRQAAVYESNAPMQKEVAGKLISMIAFPTSHSALRTLDIGIGTGFATKEFSARFPKTGIFGCDIAWGMLKEAGRTGAVLTEADAEHLPYRNETFDLAFSSLAFQWTNLSRSLTEALRVLKPKGVLYLSTFGEQTLKELADSYDSAWRSVGIEGTHKTMKFEPSQRFKSIMESAGFMNVDVKTDLMKSHYHSPEALLRSLKAIGAGNPSRDLHPSRKLLQETFRVYTERYGDKEGIPAAFEIIYARGIKK